MRAFLFGLVVWVCGAAIACSDEYIGPPPSGWIGSMQNRYVLCDTEEQIIKISKAGEGGKHDPLEAAFMELYKTIDTKGNPTCLLAPIKNMAFGESEEIGFSTNVNGKKVKTWAVHVGNPFGEWWILYGELAKGDTKL